MVSLLLGQWPPFLVVDTWWQDPGQISGGHRCQDHRLGLTTWPPSRKGGPSHLPGHVPNHMCSLGGVQSQLWATCILAEVEPTVSMLHEVGRPLAEGPASPRQPPPWACAVAGFSSILACCRGLASPRDCEITGSCRG